MSSMRALIALVAILIAGCGGAISSQSPTSLLLDENDFPPGPVKAEALPQPCSPVDVLEGQDAEVAGTPLYNLGSRYVAEAVGIAPSEEEAATAVEELGASKRLSCIRSTIEALGPGEGTGVTVGEPEPLADGEEGSAVRLLEVDADSNPVNATMIVSFRSGRCVATLLFVLRGGGQGEAFVDDLTGRAHEALADADGTCR